MRGEAFGVLWKHMAVVENKKARFDYHILERFEAGIVLLGHETKAVRAGKASIVGSYVKIYNEEAWLVGAQISPYQEKNVPPDYDQNRPRKLLLHKKEIAVLVGKTQEKNLTLVPLKLYNKGRRIKIEIALAKSKKAPDKRETIKKRDLEREVGRRLKR